jgi:hypothetical protein
MENEKVDPHRLAPTWLWKGEITKLFMSQEDVDDAWEDGWYCPKDLHDVTAPLSDSSGDMTKNELVAAIGEDSRYTGLDLDTSKRRDIVDLQLLDFEARNKIGV